MDIFYYGIVLVSLVTGYHATNQTQQCPPLPTSCQCNHKRNQIGFRISCKNLNDISLESIPNDMSVDVDLAGNNLVSLNSSLFPNPNKIKRLILRNNFIKDIADGTFKGFMSLKKLDLSGNNLVKITDGTFAGLHQTSLALLDLKENQIISISQRAFNGLVITNLILSSQLNASKENAELIAYPDFLSFSKIKRLELDNNRLLCDCALIWLYTWVRRDPKAHKLSESSTCYFPKEVRHQKFSEFTKSADWKCDQYISTFTLPLFKLYPSSNQMLFENDSFAISCQATWVQRSYIVWWINGVAVDYTRDDRIHMRHLTNLKSALYTSTLFISRLKLSDGGNVTCELQVFPSGTITAHTSLYVIGNQSSRCSSDTTLTEGGLVTWPTVLSGASVQRSCPYGGFQRSFLTRTCRENSTWTKPIVADCFFKNSLTKQLQIFYYMAKPRNKENIFSLARKFSNFSQNNFDLMRSKYDFYYAYNAMMEIMKTFATIQGRQYYKFFWGSIGLVEEKHRSTSSFYEELYGKTAMYRFRHLSEEFVIQESRKSMPFSINYHGSMAAISRLQSFKSQQNFKPQITKTWQCFIIPPSSFGSSHVAYRMQILCPPQYETKLSTVSSIYIQSVVSQHSNEIQISSLLFSKPTFFRVVHNTHLHIVSPVVGFQIKELQRFDDIQNNSQEVATWISFKSLFEHVDPRLLIWKNESGWVEVQGCNVIKPFKRITQFNCNIREKLFRNFLYFALAMKHVPNNKVSPKYMEAVLYVGAALSCLLLTCTLLIHVIIRQLRFNRNETATMMNLYVALIVIELIFAIGMHRVDNDLLCTAVAVALHYFLLCALLWLGCGGVVLVRLLRKKHRCVVNEYDPITKYYFVSWGLPLILCSIIVAYDHENYGTDEYCWLKRSTSHGAFIAPACLIVALDLFVFCYLQSLINLVYPEPLEDSKTEAEQLVNQDQCNPRSCKYKVKTSGVQGRYLDRGELLVYLRSCLLFLLFMPCSVVCVVMMYSYKNSTSYYLYQLFSYTAAVTNVMLAGTAIFYHVFKRKNIRQVVRDYIMHLRHSPAETNDETNDEQTTAAVSKSQTSNGRANETSDMVSDLFDMTHGVYGLSDHIQSEGSNIISIIDRTGEIENFNETHDQVFDDKHITQKPPTVFSDTQTDMEKGMGVQSKSSAVKSQSEMSEPDKISNGGQNSIGECSLTSSRRVRPKNPDIPENLKSFVPETWRPVKRRGKSKGSSYYPYYLNDAAPLTASVAYSSKASSSVSTTVGGVPLYIDKKRAADNLAMYSDLFQPNRNQLAPIRQPLLSNIPIAQGTGYPLKLVPSPGFGQQHPNIPLTILNPVHEQTISQNGVPLPTGHNSTMNNNVIIPPVEQGVSKMDNTLDSPSYTEQHDIVKTDKDAVIKFDESESDSELPIKIAPVIYVPMPHVTIKQFQIRSETSV